MRAKITYRDWDGETRAKIIAFRDWEHLPTDMHNRSIRPEFVFKVETIDLVRDEDIIDTTIERF